MSTRNNLTYKPLINAGISLFIIRFLMIIYSGAYLILGALVVSPILGIIMLMLPAFFTWLSNILLSSFLFVGFQRMEEEPIHDRSLANIAKICSVILIITLVLYLILTVLDLLSLVVTLPAILSSIVLYSMITVEVIIGIIALILFIKLNGILGNSDKIRDFAILRKFTLVFGIFWAFYHFGFGVLLLISQIVGDPTILFLGTYGLSIFSGIGGICEIIMAVGFILIGKRLQSTQ